MSFLDHGINVHRVRRDASRGTSVRGRRYPLIIFASGVKDLDRAGRALSSLYRFCLGVRLPFSVIKCNKVTNVISLCIQIEYSAICGIGSCRVSNAADPFVTL